jgi:homoserine kinase
MSSAARNKTTPPARGNGARPKNVRQTHISRMAIHAVSITVPASTSNLGSGFDTLGLAFQLYNRFHMARVKPPGATLRSSLSPAHHPGALRMIEEAAALFFRKAGLKPFGFAVELRSEIPVARGLGSSVTTRLAVVAGLNRLSADPLSKQQILEIATSLEGHPDNASPALFGGFTVSGRVGEGVRCLQFPVTERAQFVTLIPTFEMPTKKARALLPDTYSRADAAHAVNRAALITAALSRGDFEALRGVFDDRFHQPVRERLIPQLSRVISAGEQAGAVGGWLSGSGSAIICLALRNAERVARAMQKELPESTTMILRTDNRGLRIRSVTPSP